MELKVKVGKRGIVTALILLVILVVYNVLYFVIPFDRSHSNGAFWVSYGFTMFLILFMAVVVFLGIRDKEMKSRVFGVPIIYLGYSTLIAQFVIDAVIMSIGNFFEIKTWIPVVVETLLLGFFFISLIARTAYKDTIKKIDAQEYRESYIKELRVQLEVLVGLATDEEVKKELNKLFETVKYTDPVSNKEVVDIEDEISKKVEDLRSAIKDGKKAESLALIREIDSLVKERKLRARASR